MVTVNSGGFQFNVSSVGLERLVRGNNTVTLTAIGEIHRIYRITANKTGEYCTVIVPTHALDSTAIMVAAVADTNRYNR